MIDRRRFPRFNIGVDVTWKKITTKESTAHHISRAKDVSAGGVSLELHSSILPGDLLLLEIQFPGQNPVIAKARVIWLDEDAKVPGKKTAICEGGVEFLDVSEAENAVLYQLITRSMMRNPRK